MEYEVQFAKTTKGALPKGSEKEKQIKSAKKYSAPKFRIYVLSVSCRQGISKISII